MVYITVYINKETLYGNCKNIHEWQERSGSIT